MRFVPLALLIVVFLLPSPAPACSLCVGAARRVSLTQEFADASAVVYGHLANATFDSKTGGGTVEFHFDNILKDDPAFPKQKMILLSRYLPILDPKDAPRYVMF